MVVPIVMVCGERFISGVKAKRVVPLPWRKGPGNHDKPAKAGKRFMIQQGVLFKKFKFVFIRPGKFDPVT